MRRDRICFKCKSSYSKTHECPNKELQVLTVINGYEVEVLEDNWLEWEETVNGPEKQLMALSMNAFWGVDTPTTTKLRGRVGQLYVTIMIDSGATHNFIAPHVITAAKLELQSGCRFQVLLGTGVMVDSLGLCRQVSFSVQETSFMADFVSLELGGADMILGV